MLAVVDLVSEKFMAWRVHFGRGDSIDAIPTDTPGNPCGVA